MGLHLKQWSEGVNAVTHLGQKEDSSFKAEWALECRNKRPKKWLRNQEGKAPLGLLEVNAVKENNCIHASVLLRQERD